MNEIHFRRSETQFHTKNLFLIWQSHFLFGKIQFHIGENCFTKAKLKFIHAILIFILAKFDFILAKLTWKRYNTPTFRRSQKKVLTTYATVTFFSPDLSMKISNFSKSVHTISIKFSIVTIIHPKVLLRAQWHQNCMAEI